jgi:hypothetical protein
LLSSGKGFISDKLAIVLMCKEMKWDYFTYMSQPQWFIDLISLTNNIEAEYQKKVQKITNRRK